MEIFTAVWPWADKAVIGIAAGKRGDTVMEQIKFETPESPKVVIHSIGGSLRIRGWDRTQFRADADLKDTLSVEQKGDEIHVSCTTGCMLRIPSRSFISVGDVGRELMVKSIEGPVEIDEVLSQTILKNTGDVSLSLAKGNVTAKQIEGNLEVDTAQGNINARDIDGYLKVKRCTGNINISGFSGGVDVSADGNAYANIEAEPDVNFSIQTGGNISCRLSPEASGIATLNSGAESIRVQCEEIKDVFNLKEYELTLGQGSGNIHLSAEGSIDFLVDWAGDSYEDDFSNLAEEITAQVAGQIEAQIESITDQINQITSEIDIGGRSTAKIRRRLELQKRSMERQLKNTQKRVDHKIQDAARRNRKTRYTPTNTNEPVTNEERQMVLEMLQNNQITIEQAETLLASLEGRKPDMPPKNQETQA